MDKAICIICSEDILHTYQSYKHPSCNNIFHISCIQKWISFKKHDIISKEKLKCPCCKDLITDFQSNISNSIILNLNEKFYHKICIKCNDIFECGSKGCRVNIRKLPKLCDNCNALKIITCPECKMGLEHINGCNDFRCCKYGYDNCKGEDCDHGSTDFVKFCGHSWRIEHYEMNNFGNGSGGGRRRRPRYRRRRPRQNAVLAN